jgi:hypothetical protein
MSLVNRETEEEENDPGLILLREVKQKDLLAALIRQLNKDFQLCGLESTINEKASVSEVVRNLAHILSQLIRNDFQGFLNLLYRVDIPESKIHRSETRGMDELIQDASYELLKREWQKVWLRNKIQ